MKKTIYTSATLFNCNEESSDKSAFFNYVKKYDEKYQNSNFIVYGISISNNKMIKLDPKKFNSFYDSVMFCLGDKRDIEVYEEMSRFMIRITDKNTETEYCIRKLMKQGEDRLKNNYPLDYRLTASPYSSNIKIFEIKDESIY